MSGLIKNLTGNYGYTHAEVPDLTGRVAVVTGGTNGIGLSLSRALYTHGAKLYVISSNPEVGDAGVAYIKSGDLADAPEDYAEGFKGQEGKDSSGEGGNSTGSVEFIQCDFKRLNDVAKMAKDLAGKLDRLDLCIFLAGIGVNSFSLTPDGLDSHLSINNLSHHILLSHLFPVMRKTEKLPGADVRLVSMSSELHRATFGGPVEGYGSKFKDEEEFKKDIGPNSLYARTKLCNILFTKAVYQRYVKPNTSSVLTFATHPGGVATGQQDQFKPAFGETAGAVLATIVRPVMRRPDQGALSILWASVSPELREGKYDVPAYFTDPKEQGEETDEAKDQELIDNFFEASENVILKVVGKEGIGGEVHFSLSCALHPPNSFDHSTTTHVGPKSEEARRRQQVKEHSAVPGSISGSSITMMPPSGMCGGGTSGPGEANATTYGLGTSPPCVPSESAEEQITGAGSTANGTDDLNLPPSSQNPADYAHLPLDKLCLLAAHRQWYLDQAAKQFHGVQAHFEQKFIEVTEALKTTRRERDVAQKIIERDSHINRELVDRTDESFDREELYAAQRRIAEMKETEGELRQELAEVKSELEEEQQQVSEQEWMLEEIAGVCEERDAMKISAEVLQSNFNAAKQELARHRSAEEQLCLRVAELSAIEEELKSHAVQTRNQHEAEMDNFGEALRLAHTEELEELKRVHKLALEGAETENTRLRAEAAVEKCNYARLKKDRDFFQERFQAEQKTLQSLSRKEGVKLATSKAKSAKTPAPSAPSPLPPPKTAHESLRASFLTPSPSPPPQTPPSVVINLSGAPSSSTPLAPKTYATVAATTPFLAAPRKTPVRTRIDKSESLELAYFDARRIKKGEIRRGMRVTGIDLAHIHNLFWITNRQTWRTPDEWAVLEVAVSKSYKATLVALMAKAHYKLKNGYSATAVVDRFAPPHVEKQLQNRFLGRFNSVANDKACPMHKRSIFAEFCAKEAKLLGRLPPK